MFVSAFVAVLLILLAHPAYSTLQFETLKKDWMFHYDADGLKAEGWIAEYFDGEGNFIRQIRGEGPIKHGYSEKIGVKGVETKELIVGKWIPVYEGEDGKKWGGIFSPFDSFEEWLFGTIKLPTTGCYVFRITADDYGELRLEGMPIVQWDKMIGQGGDVSQPFRLKAGRDYKVLLKFRNRLGSAALSVEYGVDRSLRCKEIPKLQQWDADQLRRKIEKGEEIKIYGGRVKGLLDLTNLKVHKNLLIRNSEIESLRAGRPRTAIGPKPAVFLGEVDFGGSTFLNEAQFEEAEFQNEAVFEQTVFKAYPVFTGTKFRQSANFDYAVFANGGEFVGTEFKGKARLRRIRWESHAPFTGSSFADGLNMSGADFKGPLLFDGVRAAGGITFYRSLFNGGLLIRGSKLQGPVNLAETKVDVGIDLPGEYEPGKLVVDWSRIEHLLILPSRPEEQIDVLQRLESNFRKRGNWGEANKVAARRYRLELEQQPSWFSYAVWFLFGMPSMYGTSPVWLFLFVLVTYFIPLAIIIWCHERGKAKPQLNILPRHELWKKVIKSLSKLKTFEPESWTLIIAWMVLRLWKWILVANIVLVLSTLVLTESAPIYRVLAPILGKK